MRDDSIGDEGFGYIITPLPDFKVLARDIQNRGAHRIGTDQMDARLFYEFFGMSVVVVERVWELLENDTLLPEGSGPKHLLRALLFMRIYPKQGPGVQSPVHQTVLLTLRPTTNGSGRSWMLLPNCSMWW